MERNEKQWGLCKDCKWWQIEPNAHVESRTVGMCIEEELLQYRVRVSGNSGCNQFMEGDPARALGSAAKPPVAVAMR